MVNGDMDSVAVSVAEATFSAVIERAGAGQEVVITRHGKPLARVVPIEPGPIDREPGILGWEPGSYDPAVFASMTDDEVAAEGWHRRTSPMPEL